MAGSSAKAQNWVYTEELPSESEAIQRARAAAAAAGIDCVSPATGALLETLAAIARAKHVVEVGTGTGVSGSWLLAGMAGDGVLTTIDVEVDLQREARRAFSAAGIPSSRTRTIGGRAMDVLPRLANGNYDLVLLDAEVADAADHLAQAKRLLRSGGTVVVTEALWGDKVADPARRDADTVAMREVIRTVVEDEDMHATVLPTGGGVLVAVKR